MEKTGIVLVDILDDPEFDTLELFTEACNKAGNDYCKVQAFRLSDTWGIQFHPELTPETFERFLRNRIRELTANGNHESVGHYQEILDQLGDCPDGYRVLGKFIKYCLERRK